MSVPALLVCCLAAASRARAAVLDNTKLPLDQFGNKLITGEAGVLHHNGTFYYYFNDWNVGNTCPGVAFLMVYITGSGLIITGELRRDTVGAILPKLHSTGDS